MATFDESVEIDPAADLDYQFADAYVIPMAVSVFYEGSEIFPGELLDDGTFFYTQAPALFLQGFEIPIEDLLQLADNYLHPPSGLAIFLPGSEIELDTIEPDAGDTGVEIVFQAPEVRGILNMAFTEILYPVVPVNAVSKVLTKMDSQEWRAAQKASTVPVQKRSTIRFRIDTAYLATFLGDLHANRTSQFRLNTPGYTPFGINSQDNYVRLLNYTSPIREQGGLTYLMDAEFYWMAVFS